MPCRTKTERDLENKVRVRVKEAADARPAKARDKAEAKERAREANAAEAGGRAREAARAGAADKEKDAAAAAKAKIEFDRKKEVDKMPGFDGRGPLGEGPVTGGGRGYCNNPGAGCGRLSGFGRGMAYGRGAGLGRGLGRGYCRGYAPTPPVYALTPDAEMNMLREQADAIKNSLDNINGRIAELEKGNK